MENIIQNETAAGGEPAAGIEAVEGMGNACNPVEGTAPPASEQPETALLELAGYGRTDTIATSFLKGGGIGYKPREGVLTLADIEAHRSPHGPHIGIYVMPPGSTTRLGVFDLDDHEGTLDRAVMRKAVEDIIARLHVLSCNPLVFLSGRGKGAHLWLLWREPQPAAAVHDLMVAILADAGFTEGSEGGIAAGVVEVFPKSATVRADGKGALIALPLGRKSIALSAQTLKPIDGWTIRHAPDVDKLATMWAARDALKLLDAEDYSEEWVRFGLALKRDFGDDAFPIWDEFGSKSGAYPGSEKSWRKWDRDLKVGDGDDGVTVQSIFHAAEQVGWTGRPTKTGRRGGADGEKKSIAAQLVSLVEADDLWFTETNEPFATVRMDGKVMHMRIGGKPLREWMAYQLYAASGLVANRNALADAASALTGKALYEGPQHRAWLRVAHHDGKLYIDLGDPTWRAVEVRADGWDVLENPPVRFRRSGGGGALPVPEQGGSLETLGRFLNTDATGLKVVLSWLISAFRPDTPCPILYLSGEAGSAKSTATKVIRALIDPSRATASSLPDKEDDLLVSAQHNWIQSYDNLSHLAGGMSDAFCRLVYGGSKRKRELYTDGEEAVIAAQRPCLLNGIGLVFKKGDLLDRTLHVTLNRVERYRSEVEFWAEFDQHKAALFGAVLTALSEALRNIGVVQARTSGTFESRLGDFMQWTLAAETAIGWAEGEFVDYYKEHGESMQAEAANGSVIVGAIMKWFVEHNGQILQGSASELHLELTPLVDQRFIRTREWPGRAADFGKQLRHLARGFRAVGIKYEETKDRKSKTFSYRIGKVEFDPEDVNPVGRSPF